MQRLLKNGPLPQIPIFADEVFHCIEEVFRNWGQGRYVFLCDNLPVIVISGLSQLKQLTVKFPKFRFNKTSLNEMEPEKTNHTAVGMGVQSLFKKQRRDHVITGVIHPVGGGMPITAFNDTLCLRPSFARTPDSVHNQRFCLFVR